MNECASSTLWPVVFGLVAVVAIFGVGLYAGLRVALKGANHAT